VLRRCTWLIALTALACENTPHLVQAPLDDPGVEKCIARAPDGSDLTFRDCIGLSWNHDVDVLFVLDDGPHALAMQARLADALPAWIDAVLALDPAPNLRIGFTSSHDSNPGCPAHPGSAGELVARSCREHPEDFVGADGIDRFDALCAERCELDRIDVTPTATERDATASVRPWIDLGSRFTNLSDPSAAVQSAVCASLLGASGCPLSAPMNVVERVFDHESPTFAVFHRGGATTVVVLVTGRPECSITADGAPAFDPAGDRALWTDPDATAPSPGTCHAAGVSCTEPDAAGETSCVPADIGAMGLPNDDHPVLVPVDDLWEIVESIDETNRMISPGRRPRC
jgi:hypothetical protein